MFLGLARMAGNIPRELVGFKFLATLILGRNSSIVGELTTLLLQEISTGYQVPGIDTVYRHSSIVAFARKMY